MKLGSLPVKVKCKINKIDICADTQYKIKCISYQPGYKRFWIHIKQTLSSVFQDLRQKDWGVEYVQNNIKLHGMLLLVFQMKKKKNGPTAIHSATLIWVHKWSLISFLHTMLQAKMYSQHLGYHEPSTFITVSFIAYNNDEHLMNRRWWWQNVRMNFTKASFEKSSCCIISSHFCKWQLWNRKRSGLLHYTMSDLVILHCQVVTVVWLPMKYLVSMTYVSSFTFFLFKKKRELA